MDDELDAHGNMYGPGNIRVGRYIARLSTAVEDAVTGDGASDYWRVVVLGGDAGKYEKLVCYIDRTPDISRKKLAYGLLNPLLNIALPIMLKQTGGVVTEEVMKAILVTLEISDGEC